MYILQNALLCETFIKLGFFYQNIVSRVNQKIKIEIKISFSLLFSNVVLQKKIFINLFNYEVYTIHENFYRFSECMHKYLFVLSISNDLLPQVHQEMELLEKYDH